MPNSHLNEADTRAKLIDPALYARGWKEHMISREQLPGKVVLWGGKHTRNKSRIDYVLKVELPKGGEPLAVAFVEAKAEDESPFRGVHQVKEYAEIAERCAGIANRYNVRFVYSTNGRRFIEHDRKLDFTSEMKPMSAFPTPEDLLFKLEIGQGFYFGTDRAAPFRTRYPGGSNRVRYYQDAAVRAVFEKLARGEKRALLSMATGTGKTLVAVNILKRIEESGQRLRALFVCDRGFLRNQAWTALNHVFNNEVAMASSDDPRKNARVVVATYQLLNVDSNDEDADAAYIKRHYPEDYFSHVIIDECHRSAWNKWSQVLTLNPNAVHIGLTATPRKFEDSDDSEASRLDRKITADNIAYFGEPVYEYGIVPGMDDGYLAMMQRSTYDVHIAYQDESERETGVSQSDLASAEVVVATSGETATRSEMRDVYGAASLEDRLVLPERRGEMCKALFNNLASADKPEQKTIIFCVNVDHAIAVANSLNNLYSEWCRSNGKQPKEDYAFPCTGTTGSELLPNFQDNSQRNFIATTADLLTTGVDIPCVENIVFFRYIKSPILFHQMIGRGTRIHEVSGKLAFTIHDFTNATRLFGKELLERISKSDTSIRHSSPLPEKTFEAYGVEIQVLENETRIAVFEDGQPVWVNQTEYARQIGESARSQAPDIEALRETWKEPRLRKEFVDRLPGGTSYAMAIKELSGMEDVDLYDWLANVAYGEDALTREERARRFETTNADWLAQMPEGTRQTVLAICSQFRLGGTENLEIDTMFRAKEVTDAGGVAALDSYPLGGAEAAMRELRSRLFGVLVSTATN